MPSLRSTLNRILNPSTDLSWMNGRAPGEEPTPELLPGEAPRRRARNRAMLYNAPLWIGGIIVLGLFLLVLFGPLFAPENPYLSGTRTITHDAEGNIIAPPFPPSEQFPLGTDKWGRDILSLLMYGTRNTLIACAFITMARMLLGLGLGIIAGWNEGGLSDRFVMGLIGLVTALPTLIAAMIIVYALDIRRGLPVFIIALSIIGWAEIAQYVRAEFMVIKQRPFIEGAYASGLRGSAIAIRHILPNVLPQLVVITLLEMGAVLMLFGELGFVQVFIGGGISTTNAADQAVTIPDIPEWGAMMADSRTYARAKPWMILYPAAAFFVAVVGFNMLGEGLRRLSEQVEINTGLLLSKRMLAVIVVITLATIYIINNVGPAPSYAQLAHEFDSERAYQQVQTLADMEGRGNGQPGSEAAANYIAERFDEYGLSPAGRAGTYFHTVETRLVQPLSQPALTLLDATGEPAQDFRHRFDFGFVIDGHGGGGEVQAPLAFVSFEPGKRQWQWEDYQGLDLRDRIVLAFAENAPPDFTTEALIRGAQGVLWIVDEDPAAFRSQIQLASPDQDYLRKPTLPIFRIPASVAGALLEPNGLAVADLHAASNPWPEPDHPWRVQNLDAQIAMSLALSEPEDVELLNVMGRLAGKDIALDQELVGMMAHFDGLGQDPDGTMFPGANDNASGTAVMLEILRLWNERSFTPRRTMLFAVWAGANLDYSGAEAFYDNPSANLAFLQPVAYVQLANLGAGDEALLLSRENGRLAELLTESAGQVGLSIEVEDMIYHPYQQPIADSPIGILVSRPHSATAIDQDTIERIDPEKLGSAGEVLNLTLINLSRDPNY